MKKFTTGCLSVIGAIAIIGISTGKSPSNGSSTTLSTGNVKGEVLIQHLPLFLANALH